MSNDNQIEINSDLTEVKVAAEHFQQFCKKNLINMTDANLLELALVEALNNIIIHAYENISGSTIKAKYAFVDSKILITLIDHGKAFKRNTSNHNTNKNNDSELQELAEGNWGICLMNSIADDITRYREKNNNILIMTKNINK